MSFANTGKGGLFFESLYEDRAWTAEVRKHPATQEEMLKAGMSADDIEHYLDLIRQLYSELFLRVNQYDIGIQSMARKLNARIEALWKALNDFCIDHNLILEFADESGERFYDRLPFEVDHFIFIEDYPECPDIVHISTMDEFRYEVELALAWLDDEEEWYLLRRYDVFYISENTYQNDMGAAYLELLDMSEGKRRMLTRFEARDLLQRIEADVAANTEAIRAMKNNPPRTTREQMPASDYFAIHTEQDEWRKKYLALNEEGSLLDNCESLVRGIVEAGTHDDIYPHYPDETLYVHKGNIACETQHHDIEQATAILLNSDGSDIELNVSHCKDCQKFFIRYESYKRYRERFGTILGNIRMMKNGEYTYDPFDLADESTLHLCGYNVSKKDNLSDTARQTIIAAAIESGAMSKGDVIHLLNYFIEVNGAKIGNELARHKWCVDLDFTLAYKSSKQNRYRIGKVERYCRNRFCVHPAEPVKAKVDEPVDDCKYTGLRVKHASPQFGAGVVSDENDKNVVITFDNGKVVTFTRAVFAKGMVRVLE